MKFKAAKEALRMHAGLSPDQLKGSLVHTLLLSEQQCKFLDLSRLVEDVVMAISVANLEFNGTEPSKTFDRQNPAVPEEIGYAVSCMTTELLKHYRRWSDASTFTENERQSVFDAALVIAIAWDMLLAGDHDDLIEDLGLEWSWIIERAPSN